MTYFYRIRLGLATLNKMDSEGNDVDQKPKKIGQFKTEQDAKNACLEHFERVCKMAKAASRQTPVMMFI